MSPPPPTPSPCADVPITEQLVQKELRDIMDWDKLGVYLGVPSSTYRAIELQFLQVHGPGRCRNELINKWWRQTPNANWGDVIAALKEMGENRLAAHLEEKYQKPVTQQPAAQTSYQPAEHDHDLTQLPSGGKTIKLYLVFNFILCSLQSFTWAHETFNVTSLSCFITTKAATLLMLLRT